MKKQIAMALATTVLLTACGSPNGADSTSTDTNSTDSASAEETGDGKLVVWGFYEGPAKKALDDYSERTGVEVEYQTIGWGDYQTKLNTVLGTPDEPDLMLLERSFVGSYIPTNNIANMEEIYGDKPEFQSYIDNTDLSTKGPGLVDGKVKAIGWENTAGAFFYRSDLAEEAFGVTTVEEMEALMPTKEAFFDLQEQLRNSGNPHLENITLMAQEFGVSELQEAHAYEAVNDEYVITKKFGEALELTRWVNENGMVYSPNSDKIQIIPAMDKDLIFGTLLPAWGVADVKEYEQPGLWRVAKSPFSWTAGGTLIAMTNSSDKDLVWDYLQNSFLSETWLVDNMDQFGMVGNSTVMDAYLSEVNAGDEYFGGQDTIAKFSEINSEIDYYTPVSVYDAGLGVAVGETLTAFAVDKTISTVEEANQMVVDKLSVVYPSLKVTIEE